MAQAAQQARAAVAFPGTRPAVVEEAPGRLY
jgi:hypothetical protein